MLQYAKSWLVKDAQNPHRIRFKKMTSDLLILTT